MPNSSSLNEKISAFRTHALYSNTVKRILQQALRTPIASAKKTTTIKSAKKHTEPLAEKGREMEHAVAGRGLGGGR